MSKKIIQVLAKPVVNSHTVAMTGSMLSDTYFLLWCAKK
jgi:hypothetical protein